MGYAIGLIGMGRMDLHSNELMEKFPVKTINLLLTTLAILTVNYSYLELGGKNLLSFAGFLAVMRKLGATVFTPKLELTFSF